MRGRRFFGRWGLILPAALAPAIEALVIGLLGPAAAISLAPQVSAPTPLDLFHDLRWVSVYHNSWPLLAIQVLGVLVLRSLWIAWVVQRAWPDHLPPPLARASLRSVVFLVAAAFLLVPFVVLLFGLALTHLSFLFFAALPPVIAIALAIHGGAASQAMGRWWRWRPTWAGLGWLAAAFVWLTLAGAAMRQAPLPAAVAIAALAGVANARAWVGIVHSIAARTEPVRTRRSAVVPVAVATTFAVVVGGSAIGFAVTESGTPSPGGPAPVREAAPGERPVLVAAGLYSRMTHEAPLRLPKGFVAWRYSYRGVDEDGRPLSYGPSHTTQPVMVSARRMGEQVAELASAYGAPVTILAESAGALVARTYLTEVGAGPGTVDRLVSLEPHPGPSSVYLPRRGTEGWGVGTAWALRGLAAVIDGMAPFDAAVDRPLMRDLVDCGPALHRVTSSRVGGVEEVSIEALADWVDRPLIRPEGVEVQVIAAPHSGLLARAGVQAVIGDYLSAGTFEPRAGRWLTGFIAAVSSPWLAPGLERTLFPRDGCTI